MAMCIQQNTKIFHNVYGHFIHNSQIVSQKTGNDPNVFPQMNEQANFGILVQLRTSLKLFKKYSIE